MLDIANWIKTILAQPNVETAAQVEIMGEMRDAKTLVKFEEKARAMAAKAPRR
jgi:hypothetical protein